MSDMENKQQLADPQAESVEKLKDKKVGEPPSGEQGAASGSTTASSSPGNASSEAAADLPDNLPEAYKKLATEKQDLYDRLLRKQAELENFRKRVQREKEDFLQHANAEVIRMLLPVLDGFERALKHREANVPEQFYQGVELIYRQLLGALNRAGLTPIETAGKSFDPHLHQAVETVEEPGYRDQEIVEEIQRGYKLKQRLLRPAIVKVAVSSKKENSNPKSEQTASAE